MIFSCVEKEDGAPFNADKAWRRDIRDGQDCGASLHSLITNDRSALMMIPSAKMGELPVEH